METNTNNTNPAESKKDMKDDLKTMPMPDLLSKLESSPEGLSQD